MNIVLAAQRGQDPPVEGPLLNECVSMKENCIILMVKCPRKGEVKKRLSRSIGENSALEFYRRSGLDVLDMISTQDADVMVGYYPGDAGECIAAWMGEEHEFIPQTGADLGERQASLFSACFEMGYSKVCVLASDSPDIPDENITSAFNTLLTSDCVIGPSPDGGYYLIGFTKEGFNRDPFLDMEWSHRGVTGEIERRLDIQGIEWKEIGTWQDVDDIGDLKDLISRNPDDKGPKRTMEFLRRLELL